MIALTIVKWIIAWKDIDFAGLVVFLLPSNFELDGMLINSDLDIKQIQAKASNRRVRHFRDILAPLSRETKLTA